MPHIQGDRLGVYIDMPDGKHIHQGNISIQMTHNNDSMPYTSVGVEDLVEVLKGYPGLTISYEAPKRKNVDVVRDLPVGAVFKFESLKNSAFSYVRQEGDRVVDSDGFFYEVSNFDHSDDHDSIVVIYPKGV